MTCRLYAISVIFFIFFSTLCAAQCHPADKYLETYVSRSHTVKCYSLESNTFIDNESEPEATKVITMTRTKKMPNNMYQRSTIYVVEYLTVEETEAISSNNPECAPGYLNEFCGSLEFIPDSSSTEASICLDTYTTLSTNSACSMPTKTFEQETSSDDYNSISACSNSYNTLSYCKNYSTNYIGSPSHCATIHQTSKTSNNQGHYSVSSLKNLGSSFSKIEGEQSQSVLSVICIDGTLGSTIVCPFEEKSTSTASETVTKPSKALRPTLTTPPRVHSTLHSSILLSSKSKSPATKSTLTNQRASTLPITSTATYIPSKSVPIILPLSPTVSAYSIMSKDTTLTVPKNSLHTISSRLSLSSTSFDIRSSSFRNLLPTSISSHPSHTSRSDQNTNFSKSITTITYISSTVKESTSKTSKVSIHSKVPVTSLKTIVNSGYSSIAITIPSRTTKVLHSSKPAFISSLISVSNTGPRSTSTPSSLMHITSNPQATTYKFTYIIPPATATVSSHVSFKSWIYSLSPQPTAHVYSYTITDAPLSYSYSYSVPHIPTTSPVFVFTVPSASYIIPSASLVSLSSVLSFSSLPTSATTTAKITASVTYSTTFSATTSSRGLVTANSNQPYPQNSEDISSMTYSTNTNKPSRSRETSQTETLTVNTTFIDSVNCEDFSMTTEPPGSIPTDTVDIVTDEVIIFFPANISTSRGATPTAFSGSSSLVTDVVFPPTADSNDLTTETITFSNDESTIMVITITYPTGLEEEDILIEDYTPSVMPLLLDDNASNSYTRLEELPTPYYSSASDYSSSVTFMLPDSLPNDNVTATPSYGKIAITHTSASYISTSTGASSKSTNKKIIHNIKNDIEIVIENSAANASSNDSSYQSNTKEEFIKNGDEEEFTEVISSSSESHSGSSFELSSKYSSSSSSSSSKNKLSRKRSILKRLFARKRTEGHMNREKKLNLFEISL